MATINVSKDFSPDPIGRYRTDSNSSGEAFREDVLRPAIEKLGANEKLTIILDDGVESYGSSFLVEGFAGLIKHGYVTKEKLLTILEFSFSDADFCFYRDKIIQYIKDAKYSSQPYSPSSK